jgi:hypothetical protein
MAQTRNHILSRADVPSARPERSRKTQHGGGELPLRTGEDTACANLPKITRWVEKVACAMNLSNVRIAVGLTINDNCVY